MVDTFYQAVVCVLSALVEELTLNKLLTNFLYRKAGGKTMAHQETGTTSQNTMQHLSSIRMVTTSRLFTFNRWTITKGQRDMKDRVATRRRRSKMRRIFALSKTNELRVSLWRRDLGVPC